MLCLRSSGLQALEEATLESAALAQSLFQGIGGAMTQPSSGRARAGLQVRHNLAGFALTDVHPTSAVGGLHCLRSLTSAKSDTWPCLHRVHKQHILPPSCSGCHVTVSGGH